jgi:hypothetical protein
MTNRQPTYRFDSARGVVEGSNDAVSATATSGPPDALAAVTGLWIARGTDYEWFVRNYENAASRVIYEASPDGAHAYWLAPSDESSAEGGDVIDPIGGVEDPNTARLRAFELLVLADLAEVQPRRNDS